MVLTQSRLPCRESPAIAARMAQFPSPLILNQPFHESSFKDGGKESWSIQEEMGGRDETESEWFSLGRKAEGEGDCSTSVSAPALSGDWQKRTVLEAVESLALGRPGGETSTSSPHLRRLPWEAGVANVPVATKVPLPSASFFWDEETSSSQLSAGSLLGFQGKGRAFPLSLGPLPVDPLVRSAPPLLPFGAELTSGS